MYKQTLPWVPNYDEAQIPPCHLPDLMTCADGSEVTTAEEWMTKRRPELLKLFRDVMYGNPPPLPEQVVSTLLSEKKNARGGLVTRREVRLDFLSKNGARHQVIVLVYIPNNVTGKVPVCVSLTFGGNQVITDENDVFMTGLQAKQNGNFPQPGEQTRRYPIDYIMQRGYALAVASYHDFFPDAPDSWGASIYELFRPEEELQSRPKDASAIAAWAWGFSRVLDCAAQMPEINGDQAVSVGHSRLGKTSLWAGVQDERFKLICVNDSGCGGAAPDRRLYGETLFSMYNVQKFGKWWFSENLELFAEHPENLPFDQHELIALAAPRAVAVHSATEDRWADPEGEYLSALEAGPAFRLFGKTPLTLQKPPAPDTAVGTDVSYFLRTGEHDLLLSDWKQYLDAADRIFRE